MIFYKRMIGDIQAKTGHLSLSEFGAYDRLLDHYYSTEKGIPKDRVLSIARAVSKEDRKAVEFVLEEFFTLGEDGLYRQGKTEEMIADAQPKIEAARTNGAKGGRPKKQKTETQQKPTGFLNGNLEETQEGDFSKASQSQSQITGIPNLVAKDEIELDTHTARVSEPGKVCLAMKAEGIGDVNPGHPDLLMLLDAGATVAEFEGAARTAAAKQKGFAYAIGTLKRTRQDAAKTAKTLHTGPLPVAAPANQPMSFAERDRLAGIERWEKQTGRVHPDRQALQGQARQMSGEVIDITPRPLEIAQ